MDRVVTGFGEEWSKFKQDCLTDDELQKMFDAYFKIFPWEHLNSDSRGFDLGCGSGRWAAKVAPRVGALVCIEPSEKAIEIAKKNLSTHANCSFMQRPVEDLVLEDGETFDFGYSLGVLHHTGDTVRNLCISTRLLKKGAPFLLYLYYRFDNRSLWFRLMWQISDMGRFIIARLPFKIRHTLTSLIALLVYLPLARTAKLLEKLGVPVENIPLSYYRHLSFYTMRTDALDRFGTLVEKRFTRSEIQGMMQKAELTNIRFSEQAPYWVAVGQKI